jgi:hypothetical protein
MDQHEAIAGEHRGPVRNPTRVVTRSRRASSDMLGEKARTRCQESAAAAGW